MDCDNDDDGDGDDKVGADGIDGWIVIALEADEAVISYCGPGARADNYDSDDENVA